MENFRDPSNPQYNQRFLTTEELEERLHRHGDPCVASEDCLLIKLSARLDNIRCLSFNLKRNPIVYITNTLERYLPLADATSNVRLHYLASAIRSEANTFLG
ncbi:MAG: hypothetical protein IPH49_04600 [Ignavibacteria bacterium]|nr:hypothetical protein [Ignavibacteria bacterium]